MTIENIIKKIETETKAEIIKIMKEAGNDANVMRSKAKKSTKDKLAQAKDQGTKRITIMRNIHLSEARRTARRITLSAKEELIEKCFKQAKEQLKNLSGDEYNAVLKRLIKETLPYIGNSGYATLTREADRSILTSFPEIKLKPELASGLGGLILESTDGKIVLNNTFDAILERKKDDIRTEVANILYPEVE